MICSISKIHERGYGVTIDGQYFGLDYQPAEGNTSLFGGNSNWRGPVWMPMNYLLVNALQTLGEYHKKDCLIELPTGSGNRVCLHEVANDLASRLVGIFRQDETGKRKVNGDELIYRHDENFKDLVLFYEYFHGDNGRGVGATHQTGWTGVVAELIKRISLYEKK
jgi:hypothetical protein